MLGPVGTPPTSRARIFKSPIMSKKKKPRKSKDKGNRISAPFSTRYSNVSRSL